MTDYRLVLTEIRRNAEPPPTLEGQGFDSWNDDLSEMSSRSRDLEKEIESIAVAQGMTKRPERSTKPGGDTPGKNIGGMPWLITIETSQVLYASGSIAAFAVFVRNILGIAKDWRDLRGGRGERSIEVTINGTTRKFTNGEESLALIDDEIARRLGDDALDRSG